MDKTTKSVSERLAHWTANGFEGRQLYEQMAVDPELPEDFSSRETADILGVGPEALRERRRLRKSPSYIRISATVVRYPRNVIFMFLADRFVTATA